MYHIGKARDHAARRSFRGAYRSKRLVFTKPPAALEQSTGAKSAQVTCEVGNGKVLMWHVTKGQWNGASAACTVGRCTALARECPDVRASWRVLEDNDPSGYKSSKGLAAKAYAGIPWTCPSDRHLWAEVNHKMRRMESKLPNNKRETRQAYLARLRRTACSLSTDYVSSIVGDLAGRVQQVIPSQGSFFPEGGLHLQLYKQDVLRSKPILVDCRYIAPVQCKKQVAQGLRTFVLHVAVCLRFPTSFSSAVEVLNTVQFPVPNPHMAKFLACF